MNLLVSKAQSGDLTEDIPPTIPTLVAAAVASFDADRDTSRRYLLRASALLQAKCYTRVIEKRESLPRGGLIAWQLNRLVDYIETHLAERIDAGELADLINLSTSHLFRAFKASFGETPQRYIAKRRVTLACEKMQQCAEPLAQIANVCGFCDQAHLCRTFRRLMGTTPAAWRRASQVSAP